MYQKKHKSEKNNKNKTYKNLYVHEIYCPKNVLNAAKQWFFSFRNNSIENIGFWGWGEQVFIPEHFLPMLKINNVKKLNCGQLSDELFNVSRRDEKSKGWWEMVLNGSKPKEQ